MKRKRKMLAVSFVVTALVFAALFWFDVIGLFPPQSSVFSSQSYTYITTVTKANTGGVAPGPGCWQTSDPPGPVWTQVACVSPPSTPITISGILGGATSTASANGLIYNTFSLTTNNGVVYGLDFAGEGGTATPPPMNDVGAQIQVTGTIPWMSCPVGSPCTPIILVQSWYVISGPTTTITNT